MNMVVHVVCDLAATCGHDSQLKSVAIEWDVPFWDVLSFGEWHMLASPVLFKQAGMKCCSPYPSPDVCMFHLDPGPVLVLLTGRNMRFLCSM